MRTLLIIGPFIYTFGAFLTWILVGCATSDWRVAAATAAKVALVGIAFNLVTYLLLERHPHRSRYIVPIGVIFTNMLGLSSIPFGALAWGNYAPGFTGFWVTFWILVAAVALRMLLALSYKLDRTPF